MSDRYGRYEVIRELGRGSMGVVYLARDPQIGRDIALKVLRPDRVGSEDFVRRFLKEARAIGRMSHPGIVTVYDVGEDQGTVFIAMELLDGVPLGEHARAKALMPQEVAAIGVQVARCLAYAHGRGIVHRDVKPQNIMVCPDGSVKLTDFGIAHVDDPDAPHQTQAGEILGTPNYMSPEQVLGRKVDGRSDIFSLGVILYELSCGTRPFRGENLGQVFHAITTKDPVEPFEINPALGRAFSDAVMRCLAKEPDARFQTAEDLAQALQALAAGEDALHGEEKAHAQRRFPWIAAAALVVVAFAIAGAFFFLQYRGAAKGPPLVAKAPLVVQSVPEGARVFVDGVLTGSTPVTLEVGVGGHEVRLVMPGYYEWEARVDVRPGGGSPLRVELVPSGE